MFAKCTICVSLKDLISKLGKNSNEVLKYEAKLRKHFLNQESCRNLYHIWRIELVWSKDEFLCIIHDKMHHVKIALPNITNMQQNDIWPWTITHYPMGMIMHGHGDERYAQYSNALWPNDPNFRIRSLLRLLWTLEVWNQNYYLNTPRRIHSLHVCCNRNWVGYTNYACQIKLLVRNLC